MAAELAETLPLARTTPPHLEDPTQFVRLERVPILDEHVRSRVAPKRDADGNPVLKDDGTLATEVVIEHITPDQLAVICQNSQDRAERGDYGLVFFGHLHQDRDWPEHEQPEPKGYMANYQMGRTHQGEPVILADLYIKREEYEQSKTYPRRSVEVFRKTTPQGYISDLALLRRQPARDLGLITYAKDSGIEIYQCSCHDEPLEGKETMAATADKPAAEAPDSDAMLDKIAEKVVAKLGESDLLVDKIIARMGALFEEQAERDEQEGSETDKPATETPEKPDAYAGGPAGAPSGTDTTTPGDNSTPEKPAMAENENPDQMSLKDAFLKIGILTAERDAANAKVKTLETRLDSVEQYAKTQQQTARRTTRLADLRELANRYDFDPNEAIEQYAEFSDEAFEAAKANIAKHYRPNIVGQPAIETARLNFQIRRPSDTPANPNEPIDQAELEQYMRDENLEVNGPSDGPRIVQKFLKHKAAQKNGHPAGAK